MMADNKKLAQDILQLIGGKDNISFVTHCITRLRFNLKDISIVKQDELKNLSGVLGVNDTGAQYQIIIGPNVDNVYKEVCSLAGIQEVAAIDENLDKKEKQPLTLKSLGSAIMDYLSGSLTPCIPIMLASAMFKMLVAVFGPDMLGVISVESDVYALFTFVGDTAFYFFPIFVGFFAAKKAGLTPIIGAFFGALLIHPTVISMVGEGVGFTVFGIPAKLQNYSSTILPILLTAWVASYIERFFKKYIPSSLKVMGVPLCTTLITLPLMFCVLGPLGGFLGTYICAVIIWIGSTLGPIGALVIGGLWEFLVMTGMHQVMISQMILLFTENGYDPVVSLGAVSASLAVTGMCLGYFLATKDKEKKSLSLTNTVAAFVGGVTEPGIYGTGIAYKKPLIGMIAGGAAGGLYAALMGVKAYNMVPVANFLALTAYIGGEGSGNFVQGIVSGVISIIVSTVVTYIVCREKRG